MAAKRLVYGDEARAKLKAGVDKLANAVKVTLGPRGREVILEKKWGSPVVTKDGVSVAKEIELADPYENMAAQLVKEVASKTADVAGDGTTTATILTQAIYEEGLKAIASGANPVYVKRGIDEAVKIIMAGKAIAILQCSGCHNVTGSSGLRPFGQKFADMTSEDTVYNFLANYLTPQNHPPYMPYFVGKDEELRALSAYIADMISKGGSVSAKIEVPKQAFAQR